jgi:hypothetical protein
MLGTITNIEVILTAHVATQIYGVCTQWQPHANQQVTIQTTHIIGETTLTRKQSLFVMWRTRPYSWCLSKETCLTCNTCHNFYHYPRARREGKQRRLVSIGTMRPDLDASCVQNSLTLSSKLAPCFLSWSRVVNPQLCELKHFLIQGHLHVSSTKGWYIT